MISNYAVTAGEVYLIVYSGGAWVKAVAASADNETTANGISGVGRVTTNWTEYTTGYELQIHHDTIAYMMKITAAPTYLPPRGLQWIA